MESIYQTLWDADLAGNGIPALRDGERKDKHIGYVVVDEPKARVEENHRVIKEVHIPTSKQRTWKLCEALFDNYALERSTREIIRPDEPKETAAFITAILPTPVMQAARKYMEDSLEMRISNETLAQMIAQTWFHFGNAGSQPQASGFEHVFVGEQASKPTHISGYHFWYKYYLDDGGDDFSDTAQQDRISYHGTRYGGAEQPTKGILIPEVVTLSLSVEASLGDTGRASDRGQTRDMLKPVGGFFVGCSPEGLIAQGLVRCRTQSGKIAKINGAEYELDLHRLDGKPNSIRTFFPRFRRADFTDVQPSSTKPNEAEPKKTEQPNDEAEAPPVTTPKTAPFRILAAMVNPKNPEGGKEFVQIMNTSDESASLQNWQIVAPNGVSFTLSDVVVDPGDVFKFYFPSRLGVLRNKSGTITFNDANGTVQECRYELEDTQREGAPVLF